MTSFETTSIRFTALAGVLVLLLGAGHWGCAASQPKPKPDTSGQTFSQAMDLVCHVDDHIGDAAQDDPLERDQLRSDFLQDRIKNPDVIYHRTLWRVQAAKQRAKTIRELSGQAQLKGCPYADALENDAF